MLSRFTHIMFIILVLSISPTRMCNYDPKGRSARIKEVGLLALSINEVEDVGGLTCTL